MRRMTTLRAVRLAAFASVLGGILSGAAALGACSSSDTPEEAAPDNDASSVIVPKDAADASDAADAADASDALLDAAPRVCSDDGFCHRPVPKGQNLRSVWGDGTGIMWAVSNEGDILRWDGTTWKIHAHVSDDEGLIYSIFGTGPTDIWVPTEKGLFHSTGASSATLVFAPVTLPGNNALSIKGVWGTGPSDLWAVGGFETFDAPPFTQGRVLHYDGAASDGGSGWKVDADLSSRPLVYRAIWGSAGTGPWIQGAESDEFGQFSAIVLRKPPGETAWKTVALPPDPATPFHPAWQYIVSASTSSDTSVWIGGFNANFVPSYYHGTKIADGGFEWTYTKRLFFERPTLALWGFGPNDTWAVGQEGLVQHWNGTTWQSAAVRVTPLPVIKSFWGIWGTSSSDFWIVGDEIALHKTTTGKP